VHPTSRCSCRCCVSSRRLRLAALGLVGLAALLLAPLPSSAVTIDWVAIGNPGNAADTPSSNCYAASCGSVSYAYQISKYEITNAQYAEFLNAKAASDPLALYNTSMASYGITRSGVSYSYSVTTGFAAKPVTLVSFYDSLRFSNWLNNGQGSGDAETGAYTLLVGTATPSNGLTVTQNLGTTIFLTSENEWYKAAYYSALSTSYYDYPIGTDAPTVCSTPTATANRANCNVAVFDLTDVGSYTGSASPHGTYGQGGNVWEWNEQIVSGSRRDIRGGSWVAGSLATPARANNGPKNEIDGIGFRIAGPILESGTGLLVMTGLLVLTGWRRRPSRRGLIPSPDRYLTERVFIGRAGNAAVLSHALTTSTVHPITAPRGILHRLVTPSACWAPALRSSHPGPTSRKARSPRGLPPMTAEFSTRPFTNGSSAPTLVGLAARAVLLFAFLIATPNVASAQAIWIGDAGGDFSDPANWSTVAAPTAVDSILFDFGPGTATTSNPIALSQASGSDLLFARSG